MYRECNGSADYVVWMAKNFTFVSIEAFLLVEPTDGLKDIISTDINGPFVSGQINFSFYLVGLGPMAANSSMVVD